MEHKLIININIIKTYKNKNIYLLDNLDLWDGCAYTAQIAASLLQSNNSQIFHYSYSFTNKHVLRLKIFNWYILQIVNYIFYFKTSQNPAIHFRKTWMNVVYEISNLKKQFIIWSMWSSMYISYAQIKFHWDIEFVTSIEKIFGRITIYLFALLQRWIWTTFNIVILFQIYFSALPQRYLLILSL